MKLAARPSLERMIAFDRAVRAGEFPNARTIAERLEVHPRTIHRDIEFLRERCGAPLEYDEIRHGYFYRDPTYRLIFTDLTEGELIALILAERVLQTYRASPYAADLARLFGKIAALLPDTVSMDVRYLEDVPSFRVPAAAEVEPECLPLLVRAIRERRRLRIRYWSASRDTESDRLIDPYHVASIEGSWYVIAHCQCNGDVRIFAVGRIRACKLSRDRFERPSDFSIDEYLADSFAVFRGSDGERHRVRLRFTGPTVKYIAERTWHPSQTAETTPDGGLILTFKLSHFREIEKWILSWSPDCVVLEPEPLRERVRRILEAATSAYLQDGAQAAKHPGNVVGRTPGRRRRPPTR